MTTTTPVAGWYPDPLGSDDHRYWDGSGWTEQTLSVDTLTPSQPVPAQASAVAPPAPEQPVVVPQLPEQQYGPQQYGNQPYDYQPQQYGTQQYGYQPPGMRPQYGRPSAFAYQRHPAGPSLLAKVLFVVAIVFGVLLVIGILAAIAIPVFLNQRAEGQRAAGANRAHPTTVVIPDTAAGLVLSRSAASQQLTQPWLNLPLPGTKFVGVYDDAAGRPKSVVLLTRAELTPADQATFLQGAEDGASSSALTGLHRVDPGPLGGQMQCGVVSKADATICFFVDDSVGGVIDVFGTTSGDALAVHMREAVELRS